MMSINLEYLQQHKTDAKILNEMQRTYELFPYNLRVWRNRANEEGPNVFAFELTHCGNDPYENHEMIERAVCYYRTGVFSDDEWQRFFIPAINKMIAYNDNFVRWLPGYVIRHKKDGSKAIVEYDYATGFGGRNFTSLALTNIEDDGSLGISWAWASYNDYELVDTEHTEENIARIRGKNMRHKLQPPYHLKEEIARLFYGQPTRALIE